LFNGIYRSGIASDYYGFNAFGNELLGNDINAFNNKIDRLFSIRSMKAISNVNDIFIGQLLGNAFSNRKSTNARVKYANCSSVVSEFWIKCLVTFFIDFVNSNSFRSAILNSLFWLNCIAFNGQKAIQLIK